MRGYKKIMPIILTFALAGSAIYSFQNQAEKLDQYNSNLAQARIYAEKGIEKDAIEHYQEVIALNPSLQVSLEAGEVYLDHEDRRSAKAWYTKELLEKYPKEAETYLYGIRVCAQWDDYKGLFSIYKEYQNRGLSSDKVEEFVKPYLYTYSLSGTYEETGAFSTAAGLAAAKSEGRWGYVDTTGKRKISYRFDEAGLFGEYAPVKDQNGRMYYVDTGGNEKINEKFILEKDPDFGSVKELKNVHSNMILAYNGEMWNYYSLETFEKLFGGYSNALPVSNGIGAVSRDGKKWALISAEGMLLTDFVYDSILADKKDIVCRNNILIAQLNGAYILIDSSGKQIGSNSYTEARPFNDTTYAAVKKNGKWIFVDGSGEEHDFGNFEDAQSFSNGLAAVKVEGKWGYINAAGEMVVENTFYDAGAFNNAGSAFVQTRPKCWQLLRLYYFTANS